MSILLLIASTNACGMSWADLWSRPDQRAQGLLDAGSAAEAAPMLSNPRRRAYAEIKAGRFTEAAKRLAPFVDADSQYNRGNALARAGDLRAALAAYDAALKKQPDHRDARHNRDLVKRALEEQQHRAQPGGQQRNTGKPDGGESRGAQSHDGSSSDPQSHSARSSGDSGRVPGAPANSAETSQARRDALDGVEAAQKSQTARGADGDQRRDDSMPSTALGKPATEGNDAKPAAPRRKTEEQLALDQWLRRIPDDPAGLLRRKFLIEHLMKQQDSGQ